MTGAAEKKRAVKGDLLVVLAVLLLAGVLTLFLLPRQEQALSVHVAQDGRELFSCSLSEVDEPFLYTVEGDYPLVLEITGQGVRVAETACPGQDCLHTGTVTDAGRRIICLPNRLVVTLTGTDGGYDAVTG